MGAGGISAFCILFLSIVSKTMALASGSLTHSLLA